MLEYLKKLSSGPLGSVWLARMVAGEDAGRLAVARCLALAQLEENERERLLCVAKDFASVTHPCLTKGLGAHRDDEHLVILGEHVAGVPLATLRRVAFSQDIPIPHGVSLRIVRDVLRAGSDLRSQCARSGHSVPGRVIFPDTVLVAAFGESLLSDLGVSAELCRCQSIRDLPELVEILAPEELQSDEPAGQAAEVFTGGVLLWELLSGQRLFSRGNCQQTLDAVLYAPIPDLDAVQNGSEASELIAHIVRYATSRDLAVRYCSLQAMSEAIDALPAGTVASEVEVQALLQQLAGDFLSDSEWCARRRLVEFPLNRTVPISSPSIVSAMRAPLVEGYSPWEPPTLARKESLLQPGKSVPQSPSPEDDDVPDEARCQTPEPRDATGEGLDTVVPVTGLASLRLRAHQFWRTGLRAVAVLGATALALGTGAVLLFPPGSEPPARFASSSSGPASSASPGARPTPTKREVPPDPQKPHDATRHAPARKEDGLRPGTQASCDGGSGPEGTECRPASTVEHRVQPAETGPVRRRVRHHPATVADGAEAELPCRQWGI